jgi:ATP-dependent Clp protease protease subunit
VDLPEKRDILLCGELNHEMVSDAWYMVFKKEPDPHQITMWLCSPGGEFAAWSALIDLTSSWRDQGQLCTVGIGEIASGAVPILAAGTPGRRGIYRHAMVGLHEPYLDETTADPAVQANEMRTIAAMKDRFYNLLAEYTNNRPSWWRKRIAGKSMVWIDAQQAVKWRIVDRILG